MRSGSGIPKTALILGGFAALVLLVTILVVLVGPSQGVSPPPPRPEPVEAPVAENHPAREAAPPAPVPVPAAAPPTVPPAPSTPPRELFVDECAERLVRVANPHYDHQVGTPSGRSRLDRATKACQCIESVYRGLGVTDLRGEDARDSYEAVLKRHGRELRPTIYSVLSDCEHHAN